VVDVERSIERSLGKPALITFLKFFGETDEPSIDPADLPIELHNGFKRFVVAIGAGFIDRGLYPLRQYFGLPDLEAA
jgi:hypothetical protein